MATLTHRKQPQQEVRANWQTKARESDSAEYQIYRACADNGSGIDITTGRPLKSFAEWLPAS